MIKERVFDHIRNWKQWHKDANLIVLCDKDYFDLRDVLVSKSPMVDPENFHFFGCRVLRSPSLNEKEEIIIR